MTLTNALRESVKFLKSKIPTKDKLVEICEIITVSSWERIVGRYDDGVLRSLSKADLLLNFAKTSLGRERAVTDRLLVRNRDTELGFASKP